MTDTQQPGDQAVTATDPTDAATGLPADDVDWGVLRDAATAAMRRAYAPYSSFPVGAAALTDDGRIVSGCNIENATLGLTMCAERVALLKALSEGHRTFTQIAVIADTEAPTPPCGACRQLLWEFCGDLEIHLANLDRHLSSHQLADLLPLPFDQRIFRQDR